MDFITTTERIAKFFDTDNQYIISNIFGYRWSGMIYMKHTAVSEYIPWEKTVYGLTGVGAVLALPFLENIRRSDIVVFMRQIQKICGDENVLETLADQIISDKERDRLLWLIDKFFFEDPVRYDNLRKRVESKEFPQACFDCGALVGEVHRIFQCDNEDCPFCGRQLIGCDCCYEKIGLIDREKYTEETDFIPPDIYENGITDEQLDRWYDICSEKGRVPYEAYKP